MKYLFLAFIAIPIIEIGIFIQVGDIVGLGMTLIIVLLTAILGVILLKQQGMNALEKIQVEVSQGRLPALEIISAAQLLFAGGLLLTPGFLTDAIGFTLMLPFVRQLITHQLVQHWGNNMSDASQQTNSQFSETINQAKRDQRTIEGEFEDHSK